MLRVSYAYPCHDKNTATQTRAKHSRTESNTYMVNPNQDKDVPGDSFYSAYPLGGRETLDTQNGDVP
jgi:hypothetical protein